MKDKLLIGLLIVLFGVPLLAMLGMCIAAQVYVIAVAFQHGLWWGIGATVCFIWLYLFSATAATMEGR